MAYPSITSSVASNSDAIAYLATLNGSVINTSAISDVTRENNNIIYQLLSGRKIVDTYIEVADAVSAFSVVKNILLFKEAYPAATITDIVPCAMEEGSDPTIQIVGTGFLYTVDYYVKFTGDSEYIGKATFMSDTQLNILASVPLTSNTTSLVDVDVTTAPWFLGYQVTVTDVNGVPLTNSLFPNSNPAFLIFSSHA